MSSIFGEFSQFLGQKWQLTFFLVKQHSFDLESPIFSSDFFGRNFFKKSQHWSRSYQRAAAARLGLLGLLELPLEGLLRRRDRRQADCRLHDSNFINLRFRRKVFGQILIQKSSDKF
jgi:hypothetical protein